jgi:thiamine-phosphate pyrophosphorylase
MCITQDGLARSHVDQAVRLCEAGARWIQLRTKNAAPDAWLSLAREIGAICQRSGAIFIVNDSVDIAVAANADGVHLGKQDLDWREARQLLGPQRLLGGTVNNAADATRARASGCLDYVGVGPLRFTTTKQKLAPVLGLAGVRDLLAQLGPLPAWVIGGVEPSDLPDLRAAGAVGVAVSGALFKNNDITGNCAAFQEAWNQSAKV